MKRYIGLSVTAILFLIVIIISCEEEIRDNTDIYNNKTKIEVKNDILNDLKRYVYLPFDKVSSELQSKGLKLSFYPKGRGNEHDTYNFSNNEGTKFYIICVEDNSVVDACFGLSDIKKVDSIVSRFSYWEKRLQDFEFKNHFYAKIVSYDNSFNNTYNNRASFLLDFNKNKSSLGNAYEEIKGNKISGYVYFLYDRNKNKAISYVGFNVEDKKGLTGDDMKLNKINYLKNE